MDPGGYAGFVSAMAGYYREVGGPRGAWSVPFPTGLLLSSLAFSHRPMRVLEIGTSAGISTLWLASGMPDGSSLVTYDPRPSLGAGFSAMAKRLDGVEIVHRLAAWTEGESSAGFDLAFVDGDHSETATLRDLESCRAVLDGGGVVLLHDTEPGYHPAVARALTRFLSVCEARVTHYPCRSDWREPIDPLGLPREEWPAWWSALPDRYGAGLTAIVRAER